MKGRFHDPALLPPRNGGPLVPRNQVPHLVRNRGARLRCPGRDRRDPESNAKAVWRAKDVTFDVARIDEIEAVTKHDVIAFLTHLAEHIGSDDARFVHQGMTSSDVLDTTLNVQLVRATDLLLAGIDRVLAALKTRAFEHKNTVRIGRSHGIHAEPTTMGLTFARFYAEMARGRTRLALAREEIATGAISGAVALSPTSTLRSRNTSARCWA